MRSRKAILEKLYFKKQFQGTPAEEVTIEILLDIRELLLHSILDVGENNLESGEVEEDQ